MLNNQCNRMIFKIVILWSLTSAASLCFADSQWNDYTIIRPTARHDYQSIGGYYFASRNVVIPSKDLAYEDNVWHLSPRIGLRLAQIDKAVTEIYQYFLYAPDEEIVTRVNSPEDIEYFIARRIIKNSKKWDQIVPHQVINPDPLYSYDGPYIKDAEGHYVINGYALFDDGTLIKGNVKKKISGLGQIVALAEFLGDWDVKNRTNILVQETDKEMKIYKVDNEKGFSYPSDSTFLTLSKKIDKKIANHLLTDEIMRMSWFQAEKLIMFKKIAEADFSDSSTIATLIKQITVDACDDEDLFMHRKEIVWEQKRQASTQPSLDDQEWLEWLQQSLIDDEANETHQCKAETILKELQVRQKQLREYLGYPNN